MSGAPVGPALAREHTRWIREVEETLWPAERPDAGAWARWTALRYLQTTFRERLDKERTIVDGMVVALSEDQRDKLWALGELLDALRKQLDHLIGLCHRAEEFTDVTSRILVALRHWCRAVEDSLGAMAYDAIPRQSQEVLASLVPEMELGG